MGFEYSISALGAVVMQSAINSLGTVAVTGQTAGEKIRQMFTLPMESVGMGYSVHAVLSGVGELAGRSVGGWLAVSYFGFTGICFANPLAWLFALAYCSIMVRHFLRKRTEKSNEN